jgi:WD40 repeat protein
MKVLRIIIVAAVLIAAITQLQAQPNVPILEVDTLVYLGKTEIGKAAGAFFLPDGNIIAVWKGRPLIIDSKSGEIIRKLDSIPMISGYNAKSKITKNGLYLFVESAIGLAICERSSGHIIKYLDDVVNFCLSADDTKLYTTVNKRVDDPGLIIEYNIPTFERVDRFLSQNLLASAFIAASPDGKTLALSVYKKPANEYDKATNQVILIDLKDKTKYTVLETLEPTVYSLEFSPDGKQLTFLYVGPNLNIYIYI